MTTAFIGLIVGTMTRRVYGVLNPSDDRELDHWRHILTIREDFGIGESVRMLRADREIVEAAQSPEDMNAIVDTFFEHPITRMPRNKPGYNPKPLVGLIVGTTTGTVYTLTNPSDNEELDNPKLLLFQPAPIDHSVPDLPQREPVTLVIQQTDSYGDMAAEDALALIDRWYVKTRMREPPYFGIDYVAN